MKTRRQFLKSTGVGILSLLGINIFNCSRLNRPNIVMIIADDMGWDDCGAYGHPTIRTPNIDRLAKEGCRFDNVFLTISSCSPSRASILTGRYPHNTDAEQLHWPLPAGQSTFVELLKNAGYWTAAAGKWHLGEAVKDRFDVIKEADVSGFQLPAGTDPSQNLMVAKNKSGCEEWISIFRERPREQPFFLWLAALDPHRDYENNIISNPHIPEDVRIPPYLPNVPEVRQEFALYYDEINRLDGYVGEILLELKAQGVEENTLVIFFSDNGRPFPREKTTLYDGGIKTPFIIRWPKKIKSGTINTQLISSVDIAPTILNLAGLPAPTSCEGINFSRLLVNPKEKIRDYIFMEDFWHDYEDLTRAVRSLHYKYIINDYNDLPATPPADVTRSQTFKTMQKLKTSGKLDHSQMSCFIQPRPKEELYDIVNDPFELLNLANLPAYEKIRQEHRKALEDWSVRTNFKIPSRRTADEFNRQTGEPLPNRIRPRPSKEEMRKNYK